MADGDTVAVSADLGLGLQARTEPVRLLGIQAPEMRGAQKWLAQESKRVLTQAVLNQRAYLETPGDQRDRYGRWLGWIWLPVADTLWCVNSWMVAIGQAEEWWPRGWGHRSEMPPVRLDFDDGSTGE